jgi:hypothetical protein
MKNAYLNSVFILRLYLRIIQKKTKQKTQKKILLIKQRKNEKNKIIKHIK